MNRDDRLARYYDEGAGLLSQWLVDAEDEISQLEKDSNMLAALEAVGVDNWEGYSDAMSLLQEWEDDA